MASIQNERERDARYPISRWYVRPAAGWAARRLCGTWVRPCHLTGLGAVMAIVAVTILVGQPESSEYIRMAAIPVWLAWFFDRADGMLARRQGTVSAWGAWLDANVDELVDLTLQTAVAMSLARQLDAPWPWFLLVAFLVGKYLLMYGLTLEESLLKTSPTSLSPPLAAELARRSAPPEVETSILRRLYHLPGNCDVRVHWLILMLLCNQLAVELAAVAFYYNVRWIVRYAIVWRRLKKGAS